MVRVDDRRAPLHERRRGAFFAHARHDLRHNEACRRRGARNSTQRIDERSRIAIFSGCFDRGGAGFENVIDCAIAARFAHEGPVLAA